MTKAPTAETLSEVWRTPKEWSVVMAVASERASVHPYGFKKKIGYKPAVLEAKSTFKEARKTGAINGSDYKKANERTNGHPLMAYSRAAQVAQAERTLEWIFQYGGVTQAERQRWLEEAKRVL